MHRILMSFVALTGLHLCAQQYPANEFFIGASAKAIIDGPTPMLVGPNYAHSLTTHDRGKRGFEASFTHNVNSRLGMTADFSEYFSNEPRSGKFNSAVQAVSADV